MAASSSDANSTCRLQRLDPATLTWTLLGNTGKSDFNAEEGWTLLPDGTVFTFMMSRMRLTQRFTLQHPNVDDCWEHHRRPSFAFALWMPPFTVPTESSATFRQAK